jgi:[CysO sulfur-carrier protein]-S-L-cysteine hydrolase
VLVDGRTRFGEGIAPGGGGSLASAPMLRLSRHAHLALVGHAYDGLPDEACGLLGGVAGTGPVPDGRVDVFYPCRNVAESSRVYTVDPKDHLRADRDAEDRGLEILGVVHSHTHTEAYPSPTDVGQAPDPDWHYVIVSLKREEPVVRSYRIVDGEITEEAIAIEER